MEDTSHRELYKSLVLPNSQEYDPATKRIDQRQSVRNLLINSTIATANQTNPAQKLMEVIELIAPNNLPRSLSRSQGHG